MPKCAPMTVAVKAEIRKTDSVLLRVFPHRDIEVKVVKTFLHQKSDSTGARIVDVYCTSVCYARKYRVCNRFLSAWIEFHYTWNDSDKQSCSIFFNHSAQSSEFLVCGVPCFLPLGIRRCDKYLVPDVCSPPLPEFGKRCRIWNVGETGRDKRICFGRTIFVMDTRVHLPSQTIEREISLEELPYFFRCREVDDAIRLPLCVSICQEWLAVEGGCLERDGIIRNVVLRVEHQKHDIWFERAHFILIEEGLLHCPDSVHPEIQELGLAFEALIKQTVNDICVVNLLRIEH